LLAGTPAVHVNRLAAGQESVTNGEPEAGAVCSTTGLPSGSPDGRFDGRYKRRQRLLGPPPRGAGGGPTVTIGQTRCVAVRFHSVGKPRFHSVRNPLRRFRVGRPRVPIGAADRRVQRSPRVCAARRPLWLGGESTSRVNDAPTRWVTLRGTASVTTNARRLRLDQRRDYRPAASRADNGWIALLQHGVRVKQRCRLR
jgi:hypothetical protein